MASTCMACRYPLYREEVIVLRHLIWVCLNGSLLVVPSNKEYQEELSRNPHNLLMHWLVGLPGCCFISIMGMKVRNPPFHPHL